MFEKSSVKTLNPIHLEFCIHFSCVNNSCKDTWELQWPRLFHQFRVEMSFCNEIISFLTYLLREITINKIHTPKARWLGSRFHRWIYAWDWLIFSWTIWSANTFYITCCITHEHHMNQSRVVPGDDTDVSLSLKPTRGTDLLPSHLTNSRSTAEIYL